MSNIGGYNPKIMNEKHRLQKLLLKVFLFVELIGMLVCVAMHLITFFIMGEQYPLSTYPIIAGLLLVLMLAMIFIVIPLAEWVFREEL